MVQRFSPRMSFVLLSAVLLWGAPLTGAGREARAQEPAPSALAEQLDLSLSGYVAVSYTQNFNNPDDGVNQNRIFDGDANSFRPNMAQIVLERTAGADGGFKDRAGFRVKLNVGEDAKFTGGDGGSEEFDFQEAYVQYAAPWGRGVQFQAGRMNTLIGYEVIESPLNPNFSRSFLFGMGEPFTVTGLRASYDVGDGVSFSVSAINSFTGAQVDDNSGKSVEALLSFTPREHVGLSLFGFWGPEAERGRFKGGRVMVGGILDVQVTDKAQVVLEGYYGNQANDYSVEPVPPQVTTFVFTGVPLTDVVVNNMVVCPANTLCNVSLPLSILQDPVSVPRRNDRWNGVAGYFLYDFNDRWSFRLRGEVFEDAAGSFACGGAAGTQGNALVCAGGEYAGQTLWETTWTLQYEPVPNFITRAEFRYDKSDKNTFTDGIGKTGNNQSTLAMEAIVLF